MWDVTLKFAELHDLVQNLYSSESRLWTDCEMGLVDLMYCNKVSDIKMIMVNLLTHNSQKTGFLKQNRKRKCQKTDFNMNTSI